MDGSGSNHDDLKKRLAGLAPEHRKVLLEKLKRTKAKGTNERFESIPKAKPLDIEQEKFPGLRGKEVRVFPASHAQERMWFLHEYSFPKPVYSSPMAFRLKGHLDGDQLERAFTKLIGRHDSLRTTFVMGSEGLLQCVHSKADFRLDRLSLEGFSEEQRETEEKSVLKEYLLQPFDLVNEIGIRAELIELTPREHILLIVVHHSISDGWSRANLCKELSLCYNELVSGHPAELPVLKMQHADYTDWQSKRYDRPAFREHLDYWNSKLSAPLEPINLPLDKQRPENVSSRGSLLGRPLDQKLIDKLQARAQEEGSTLFMILLAGFKVLLHKYSESDDLIVGIPIANRNRADLENQIGCFINTLSMRTDLSGDPSFIECLHRVRDTAVEAFAHQEVPFEYLITDLGVERDPSRTPVFQTTFALQDFPMVQLNLDDLESIILDVDTDTSKVEIAFQIEPIGDEWWSHVEYNSDLFEKDRIQRMLGHWETLLESIAENPNLRLSELDWISPDERDKLLSEWNKTSPDPQPIGIVHGFFEDQVLKCPDDPALVCGGETLTYHELNVRANQLAHYLRDTGVKPNQLVGVSADRSVEMIIAVLGILKAGGAYVPIDPSIPVLRIEQLVQETGLEIVISPSAYAYLFPVSGPVIMLDQPGSWLKMPTSNPEPIGDKSSLAYVLFTSGSTGRPKGVMIEHRQIVNYVMGVSQACSLGQGSYAMLQPLNVDSSQSVLFPAFYSGGTVHLIPWDLSLDAEGLADYFDKVSIDYLKIAPTHYCQLLTARLTERLLPNRRLLLGGEGLDWSLIETIRSLKPRCRVWNHYGPTETTVGVLTQEINLRVPVLEDKTSTVPIGKPLSNIRAHVLDTYGHLLPVGHPGEIYIGGLGVGRGYLNDMDATNAVFVHDHISRVEGERLYRTGDFGKRLPNGAIEYLGRSDNQIKLRGFRIEIGEIEFFLNQHPDVQQTLVVLDETSQSQASLVAFIEPVENKELTGDDLRQYLGDKLPSVMLPGLYTFVQSFPLTSQGKVDRSALSAIPPDNADIPESVVKVFDDEVLATLCKIWKEVLNLDTINTRESFFNLGGNSLIATLVVVKIHRELGYRLSIREFFNYPTLEGLTELIHNNSPELSRQTGSKQVTTGNQREQVLEVLNLGKGEKCDYPVQIPVHNHFETIAATLPASIALVQEGESLSYEDLNRRANILAHRLIEAGVNPGAKVGICLNRSFDMVTAILGVLKCGAAYVPLDPLYPKYRLISMIQDANLSVVVSSDTIDSARSFEGVQLIHCESKSVGEETFPSENPRIEMASGELAYIIYTSGSTGRPKGVQIEHRSLVNYIYATNRYYELSAEDRVLQLASLNFDASVEEIFCPLLAGGTLVLRNEEMLSSPAYFVECCEAWGITVLPLPTAFWHTWVSDIDSGSCSVPSKLRLISVGGEALHHEAFKLWRKHFGATIRLINGYGPTETTVCASFCDLTNLNPGDSSTDVPIGRPVDNMDVYVLDEYRQPVPPGVAGELYIGGVGVARGYLNQPEQTEEHFITNPFDEIAGSRLYKTGDKVFFDEEGRLVYLGRFDFQLKVRGFRIEPGEIESVLIQHPDLRACAVTGFESESAGIRLAAYLVFANSSRPTSIRLIRQFLKEQLPEFMIPASFTILLELPLTPSGKVDRKALPDPVINRELEDAPLVHARNAKEEAMVRLWADILEISEIGVEDNFFDLGGHSLMMAKLVGRIKSHLNIDVPLRLLFDHPTVADLCHQIDAEVNETEITESDESKKYSLVPLSFPQQRLWFLDRFNGGSSEYHISRAYCLKGEIDHSALEKAINDIIRRHESLRTSFEDLGGSTSQKILSSLEISLGVTDLRDRAREQIDQILVETKNLPFDLGKVPLLRADLFQIDEEEHIFLFTVHHIVFDGWSHGNFSRELSALYQAYLNNQVNPLEALSAQYSDFSVWQREWLESGELPKHVEFWKHALEGATNLEMPTDRPRPPRQKYRGNSYRFSLGQDISELMKAFCKQERVTPFMVSLAAYQALLFRYSGQEDVLVGTPIANRLKSEFEPLIGFFVNTLVIRGDLSGQPGFREVVRRLRNTSLDAFQYQNLPFEKLVEVVNPVRDQSRHPIFQVVFSMQNTRSSSLALEGLEVEEYQSQTTSSHFDLEFHMFNVDGQWVGRMHYNTDLYDHETIVRFMEHYQVLLASLLKNPETPVSELPILKNEERQRLLEMSNNKLEVFESNFCIHELVEKQSALLPNSVALVCDGKEMTYQQLNARANQLARFLRKKGVVPDQLVGVCMERSIDLIIALLGVLKAGAAYLPIDLAFPADRSAFMLKDGGVKILLTQIHLLKDLPVNEAEAISIDDPGAGITSENTDNLENVCTTDDLAYTIYTSGSTGRPKGVQISHRNVARLFRATEDLFHFNSEDVWTLYHSCAFDFSVWEIWGALLYGGRLVVVPYQTSRSPKAFYRLLSKEKVTILNQTPSAFGQLTAFEEETVEPVPLALRWIVFGGETLDLQTLRPWFNRHGDEEPQLVNMYGITETSVHVTHRVLGKGDLNRGSVIGEPISDLSFYILDSHLEPVPVGVSGQIFVGGAGLARGYLNQAELTAERFIDDPFSAEVDAKLYQTGDLARRLADGEVEYLGRMDHQVQLRGFRIELGEIESVLVSHPDIRDVRIMLREDEPGDKRLAVYFIIQNEVEPSVTELREFVANQLPTYMMPASFTAIDKLPLTPNGKMDWKALPAPQFERVPSETPLIKPRTSIEKDLVRIWSQILKIDEVSVTDKFFELGGHSLLATQVVNTISRDFGVEVSLVSFFNNATIEDLAKEIESISGLIQVPDDDVRELVARDRFPLSFQQKRLWFLDRIKGGSSEYNIPNALKLQGDLDRAALEKAFNALVQRHEILRTFFEDKAGEIYQVVAPQYSMEIPLINLRGLSTEEREVVLIREGASSFDLEKLPLLRVKLFVVDEKEYLLFINIHHIISDGVSLSILHQELCTLYNGFCSGKSVELAPLSLQYGDYVYHQQKRLQGEYFDEIIGYWREQLKDPSSLELPIDFPRPSRQTFRGSAHSFSIPAKIGTQLKAFNTAENITPFMSSLAAFQVLLSRYSGQTDILVGTPVANRPLEEEQQLIGFFVNTLVLRADLSQEPSFRELVRVVRETALNALQHQELPFEKVVEDLNPTRDPSRHPIFQVMYSYNNLPESLPEFIGLEVSGHKLYRSTTHFDLSLGLTATGDSWIGQFSYNTDLFESGTIERLSRHFLTLLEGFMNEPDRPVSKQPILTNSEMSQLLDDWNNSALDYPEDLCIHDLFEKQVQSGPDRVALEFEGQELKYSELGERVDELARHLKTLGVGEDKAVGICLERSMEMVIGLLAILKAGGAYVPLDPHFPASRLSFIMEDSGIQLLVTQRTLENLSQSFTGPRFIIDDWHSDGLRVEPLEAISPRSAAYIIYTSGSTGQPKGTVIEHQSAVNMICSVSQTLGIQAEDVFLAVSTISFDISVFEIFASLAVGARLVIMPDSIRADGFELANLIESCKATIAHGTPSMWKLLLYAGWKGKSDLKALAGGETLTSDLAAKLLPKCRELWNLYGPTETTVYSLAQRIINADTIPIGSPIGNTQVYIVDPKNQLVPAGVPGELLIGGRGLAREYLKRPELTAERFIRNPFSGDPKSRVYRTGDLCRWRIDGTIDYLGRFDNQVKIRGFRIELAEIEASLGNHTQIRECVTKVEKDPAGEDAIFAYYVPTNMNRPPHITDLQGYLRSRLPDYMVPASFVLLENLPLTPNGKIDRKALSELKGVSLPVTSELVKESMTDIEKVLKEIWEEVTGRASIGLNDNFFELGGHSLLAVQVVSRIKAVLTGSFSIRQLFENPTIAELARQISPEAVADKPVEKE